MRVSTLPVKDENLAITQLSGNTLFMVEDWVLVRLGNAHEAVKMPADLLLLGAD
jgi:hypothetical protein